MVWSYKFILGYGNNPAPFCPGILSFITKSSISSDLAEKTVVARENRLCIALVQALVTKIWLQLDVKFSLAFKRQRTVLRQALRSVLFLVMQTLQNAVPLYLKLNLNWNQDPIIHTYNEINEKKMFLWNHLLLHAYYNPSANAVLPFCSSGK